MPDLVIDPVTDLAALEGFHATEVAAFAHDHVALPADPIEELLPLLDNPESAGERVHLFLARLDGEPVGGLSLHLPTLDNLGVANVGGQVHPDHRRQGFGRQLLARGLEEVRQLGRTRVFVTCASDAQGQGSLSEHLVASVGARPVLAEYRRLLDLEKHPAGERPTLPDGYRLVQWLDRAPDEVVDGAAYLMSRMVLDAPMGDMDYEQEKWDAARYRDKEEAAIVRNRLRVSTAVVHASGAVAGLTEIGVNRTAPLVGYQWDTIVDPDHRGHGLGYVLKTWNHAHLVETLPDVRYVNTWNAGTNSFMIAVNERLGFEVADTWTEYQLDL